MSEAEALDVALARCLVRTRRAIDSLRHIKFDLDPAHDGQRLRPCACGRQWTRQATCAVCAAEVLERHRCAVAPGSVGGPS